MWENEMHPAQAEVHEPIVTDEDLWAHEMSDEPEQPEHRLKDLRVNKFVVGLGTIEVYGQDIDGNFTWILLHVDRPEIKFLGPSDYDED
jgi:hypothetical protein